MADVYRLEVELPRYGCDVDPETFREVVAELKEVMFPCYTDEELLYHLDDSRAYVMAVRSRIRCLGLPDFLILRTMINVRKNQFRCVRG